MSKQDKKSKKSELGLITKASILGSLGTGGTLLPFQGYTFLRNKKTINDVNKEFLNSDYVYDLNKIISKNPKLKEKVTVLDSVPKYLRILGIPIGKEEKVKLSGSFFGGSNKGGFIATPMLKGDKGEQLGTVVGLHEIGHATNIVDNKAYYDRMQKEIDRANTSALITNLLSASRLGEDNPLLVGGLGSAITGVIAHKTHKARMMEELKASARALNYIRKNNPGRLVKDGKLLRKALGTYKHGLPLYTATYALSPLVTAYARQYLGTGEIKRDKLLENIFPRKKNLLDKFF